MSWHVLTFNATDASTTPEALAAVQAWLSDLGVDPLDVANRLVISQTDERFDLHLSQIVRDAAGKPIVDHAVNAIASTPLVIDLGTERSWPAQLNHLAEA